MGNYVFTTSTLIEAVTRDARDEASRHDLGGDIIPMLVEQGEAYVYDFSNNEVPGDTPADRGYWRDVGTLDAYHDAHMDLTSVTPAFSLYNSQWPILSWPDPLPPAKFVFEEEGRTGVAVDSLVCAGVIVSGGRVRRSILSPGVRVHSFAEVDSSVLLHGVDVGRNAIVRNAILDKNVVIGEGVQIGVDPEADRERFVVSDGGHRRDRQEREGRGELKVALLTREYPPEVYGGAGVHVEYLARDLARLVDLTVHCWGSEREPSAGGPAVRAYRPWDELAGGGAHAAALEAVSIDLAMAAGVEGTALVHSHTWYANLAGHLAKLLYGIPHVATVHSLEPMRPWKAEQLAGGYAVSSFCERTGLEAADAIIAVSREQARDVLACYPAIDPARISVIYNGIDSEQYRPDPETDVLARYGIDPQRPSVVFVGRITRQKGVTYALDAALQFDPASQFVLCAGAPDTPEIAAEIEAKVARVRGERGNIIWIDRMLAREEVVQILSHATVFLCPSIYEPLGIVNLEAMACETAVVATRTGGIPEVVEDGETGLLVPFEPRDDGSRDPVDPARFARDIAERVNELLADPERAKRMGEAGRARAIEQLRLVGDRGPDRRALPRAAGGRLTQEPGRRREPRRDAQHRPGRELDRTCGDGQHEPVQPSL